MATGLSGALLRWYDAERRELPWRRTTEPYPVLVSETMLQQTTVAVVVPYFERWMTRFPTVESLALSDEETVLAQWQGLGYYRRARSLLACARLVVESGWPLTFAGWLELPGVGKYTAGAVCSICLGERVPAIDGNVERVFARVAADPSSSLKSAATTWARGLVDCNRPGDVNQALMDLGATVCRPKNPDCGACPVSRFCSAFAGGMQNSLPTPKPTKTVVQLTHEYVVPFCKGQVGVRQFGPGEWWAGLYGFPARNGEKQVTDLLTFTHTVTHHKVTASAVLVRTTKMKPHLQWKSTCELERLPMPAPHRKILNSALNAIYESGSNATGTAKVPSSAKK